jgi:hypothetical protein
LALPSRRPFSANAGGKVLDATADLDGVPDGYRAMADRESIKVLVKP